LAFLLLSGLASAAIPTAPVIAQPATTGQPAERDPHSVHVAEASRRFGIPVAWIKAVIRLESAGVADAVSSAGARGLMQIMPVTWEYLRERWSLGRNPFDPRDNILAGTAYLRELHDRYGSPGFLAAYNAGPGRYRQYLAGDPLPAETRAYVARLAAAMGLSEQLKEPAASHPDWRDASLFVERLGNRDAGKPQQAGRPSSRNHSSLSGRQDGASNLQDEPDFAANGMGSAR
jgi:hypothetical protein